MTSSTPRRAPKRLSSSSLQSGLTVLSGGNSSLFASSDEPSQIRASPANKNDPFAREAGESDMTSTNRNNITSNVPVDLSTEFLAAIMSRRYTHAKVLCEQILAYDPNHDTAKQFLPLIQEKLALDESESGSSSDESSEEDDNSHENSSDEDISGQVELSVPEDHVGSGVLLRGASDALEVKKSILSRVVRSRAERNASAKR